MFPNQKVLREEKKDWIVTLEGNHSYWKKFHAKSDEKQKIFSCTPVTKFQKISTLNICNETKQIYPKKQKKNLLRKDTRRVSEAVIWRCWNVLEWLLLITSKEYTLYICWPDLQNFYLSRNHPMLHFWLKRKGQKMLLG